MRCQDCRFWKRNTVGPMVAEKWGLFGKCLNDKAATDSIDGTDAAMYDHEQTSFPNPNCYTGQNFGCIHFEAIKSGVENA